MAQALGAVVPIRPRRVKPAGGQRDIWRADAKWKVGAGCARRRASAHGPRHAHCRGTVQGTRARRAQGLATRPTSARAREAIFNILEHADWSPGLEGRRVLDLFAGAGAFGLESLSRGASFALFVETDAPARGAIRDSIEALGLFGVTRIHRRDATDLGVKPAGLGERFDLVFLDPPYAKGLGERALAGLANGGWITPHALMVFECGANETPVLTGFATLEQRNYGAAKVLFLRAD